MKKKQIIILAAAGIFSFAGVFAVTWFVKKSQPVLPEITEQTVGGTETTSEFFQAQNGPPGERLTRTMTEKQLQNLIYDIREKMKEHRIREKELDQQEQRLNMTRDTLQEDIDRLNALRIQLTTTLSALKEQEAGLKRSVIEIAATEKTNMKRIANRYNKMKPQPASEIMINMIANNQINDAVMILYYMEDRNAAKLLNEIRPEIAAQICNRLKRIKESE